MAIDTAEPTGGAAPGSSRGQEAAQGTPPVGGGGGPVGKGSGFPPAHGGPEGPPVPVPAGGGPAASPAAAPAATESARDPAPAEAPKGRQEPRAGAAEGAPIAPAPLGTAGSACEPEAKLSGPVPGVPPALFRIQTPVNGIKPGAKSEALPEKSVIVVGIRPDRTTIRGLCDRVDELPSFLAETELAWVNVHVDDLRIELPAILEKLGFCPALLPPVLQDRPSAYEDRESDLALRIPAVKVSGLDVVVHPLLVFMRRGLIVTVSDRQIVRLARFARYAEPYFRKLPPHAPWNDHLTILLARILDENNERNYDGLRTIEEEADKIGQNLAEPTTNRMKIGEDIYRMKHALITYLNMLWATLDVINTLRYGDAEIITDSESVLTKIELLGADVTRHIQLSENLSEVLASGLEILQGIYNNQLQILSNRMTHVMTWLTILGTAVLVPNTIATAMGSTAFALEPSDKWWYLTLLALSTVVATVGVYYIIRRKMHMPTNVE